MDDISIRVTFTKTGRLKYISHLDLQRAICRLLYRSGLPIGHTEGFNPHPKISLALPLSVYQEGENEVLDFRITEDVADSAIIERLNKESFDGLVFKSVSRPEGKSASKKAVYRLELQSEMEISEFTEAFGGKMPVAKRTKSGETIIDISPMTELCEASKSGNVITARVILPASGSEYLNPLYVAAYFGERVKLLRTVREKIVF